MPSFCSTPHHNCSPPCTPFQQTFWLFFRCSPVPLNIHISSVSTTQCYSGHALIQLQLNISFTSCIMVHRSMSFCISHAPVQLQICISLAIFVHFFTFVLGTHQLFISSPRLHPFGSYISLVWHKFCLISLAKWFQHYNSACSWKYIRFQAEFSYFPPFFPPYVTICTSSWSQAAFSMQQLKVLYNMFLCCGSLKFRQVSQNKYSAKSFFLAIIMLATLGAIRSGRFSC